MPELPEVETTRQGIAPFLLQQSIAKIIIRQDRLRLPVTPDIDNLCAGKVLQSIDRRAKYLLLHLSEGSLLVHLGMSGRLRIIKAETPTDHKQFEPGKHDHIDLCLNNGIILRYNDPRRFGLWLYIAAEPLQHRLLRHLGPEPLSAACDGGYLHARARGRSQCIKSFIMCSEVIVGVGNIYAAESLFLAKIHPQTPAGIVTRSQMDALAAHIKNVLQQAINAGGTTLRDFYKADGNPGYFATALKVYGRQNMPCYYCQTMIKSVSIAGRNSAFCPACQPGCNSIVMIEN